jgi:predicted CoA-binding protein
MKAIAIVGASADRNKFGNIAVRAYRDLGWTVYPINPNATEIEGVKAYASLRDVPGPVERVSVYLPPRVTLTVLEDIAAAHAEEVWLNPGSESSQVVEKAHDLGINVIQACSLVDQGVPPSRYLRVGSA